MLKSELIHQLTAKMQDCSVPEVAEMTENIIDALASALCSGSRIEIRSFGTFSLRYHAARKAHNPKTGTKLVTAPKYLPHFKPGKILRERVL